MSAIERTKSHLLVMRFIQIVQPHRKAAATRTSERGRQPRTSATVEQGSGRVMIMLSLGHTFVDSFWLASYLSSILFANIGVDLDGRAPAIQSVAAVSFRAG